MITVSQIWTYPFKSAKGIPLQSTKFDPEGMCDDRRLVATDKNGVFITARRYEQLLQLSCTKNDTGWLLQHPSLNSTCQINTSEVSEVITGNIWKDDFNGLDAGDKAANWISELLKIDARIAVWKKQSRYSNKYQLDSSFADAAPMLITSEASIQQACEWGGIESDVRRFRPNIVLKGVDAFAEDKWSELSIGNTSFKILDVCIRCILTTRDPDTGEAHPAKQPMAALMKQHSNDDNLPLLGVNATLTTPADKAVISVGDEVRLLQAGNYKKAITNSHHK